MALQYETLLAFLYFSVDLSDLQVSEVLVFGSSIAAAFDLSTQSTLDLSVRLATTSSLSTAPTLAFLLSSKLPSYCV